ncbi:MAG TPA: copper transporter [Bacillota bacterium]|nr:copper transporter [Bacillota bacterium]
MAPLFDYREYLVAVAGIFLALALGILIGVSFGDDFLVSNQREVIERLEKEMNRLKEELRQQGENLERWEEVRPVLWRSYRGALEGKKLLLLARSEEAAMPLFNLLASSGAEMVLAVWPEATGGWPGELETILKEGPTGARLAEAGFVVTGLEAEAVIEPEWLILMMQYQSAQEDYRTWNRIRAWKEEIVAAYPWDEKNLPLLPPDPGKARIVDNINTFWGQLALLEILLTGNSGYYGFGPRRTGLLPPVAP